MGCCNLRSKGKAITLSKSKNFLVDPSDYIYLSKNEISVLTYLFQNLTYNYKTGKIFEKSDFLYFIKAPVCNI